MLKDWVRFGIILGSSVSHTSHPTPRGILCTVLRFSHFCPFSSAVTGNTVVFRLGYAVAAFWVSLFLSLSLTVCFQCSRRGDPCISKSNHVTSLLKLCGGCASLRLKSEVFTTARKAPAWGFWPRLLVRSHLLARNPSVSPYQGLLASGTRQAAFYLEVFTWAPLFAWNALSPDTCPDSYLLWIFAPISPSWRGLPWHLI